MSAKNWQLIGYFSYIRAYFKLETKFFPMKRISILLVGLFVCLASFSESYAQLSKEEKKEWKTKYKAYKKDLEAFKNLVEENSSMKSQINNSRSQISNLQSQIADKDAQISDLQAQNRKLGSDVSTAQAAARKAQADAAARPAATGDWDKGVVFRVQIGAFENAADMEEFNEGGEEFNAEKSDGMQKVTLGNFRDYWVADKFKKSLRQMGVKDAWIVPFKDGQRVDIKDVLEGVVE